MTYASDGAPENEDRRPDYHVRTAVKALRRTAEDDGEPEQHPKRILEQAADRKSPDDP
jgi:hypothetical protein